MYVQLEYLLLYICTSPSLHTNKHNAHVHVQLNMSVYVYIYIHLHVCMYVICIDVHLQYMKTYTDT
jgi:hypothetical protein